MNEYEKACLEFLRGCSCANDGRPQECEECAAAFVDHIKSLTPTAQAEQRTAVLTEGQTMTIEIPKHEDASNICRVFEVPATYPQGFCFGGGLPVAFKMVDWFNPVPPDFLLDLCGVNKPNAIDELEKMLREFLSMKQYLRDGYTYIALCEFGLCFSFHK